jgi:hypothetical protein
MTRVGSFRLDDEDAVEAVELDDDDDDDVVVVEYAVLPLPSELLPLGLLLLLAAPSFDKPRRLSRLG